MEDTIVAMCRVTRNVETHQKGLEFVDDMKTRLQQVENITVQFTVLERSFEETTNEIPS
jgi:hypothetical protein